MIITAICLFVNSGPAQEPPPVEVPAVASVCRVVSMCMYSYKEGVPGENSSGHMDAQETREPTPRGRPPSPTGNAVIFMNI
jgi:hypothetical protein